MMYLSKPLFRNNMCPEFPFDGFFRSLAAADTDRFMRVNVREEDDRYVLEAEMPGMKKEDITLEVRDDALTVSAETHEEKEENREGCVCAERRRSFAARRFSLEGINRDAVTAAYENGVLTVNLPKLEEKKAETRRIEVA